MTSPSAPLPARIATVPADVVYANAAWARDTAAATLVSGAGRGRAQPSAVDVVARAHSQ